LGLHTSIAGCKLSARHTPAPEGWGAGPEGKRYHRRDANYARRAAGEVEEGSRAVLKLAELSRVEERPEGARREEKDRAEVGWTRDKEAARARGKPSPSKTFNPGGGASDRPVA